MNKELLLERIEGMKRDTGFLHDKARNKILDDVLKIVRELAP